MADEDVFGADEVEAEGEVELTLEELAPIELYDTEQLKEEDEEAAKEEAKEEEELEATRAELPTPARAPPPRISSVRTDTELFVVRKRNEATYRDTACKAICKIKHGLRQPGAQDDGRPVSLADWDENYKPNLGSYIKFLLSRPDQFRVVEGAGPGFYTIEDVTNNRTTVAPVKGDKGKGKGKWKGEDGFKGKGKGKGKDGDFKGKGKDGKGKGKFKGKDKSDGAQPAPFPSAGKGKGKTKAEPTPPSNAPTKAAKLLAAAAKEALAAEVSTQDPEFADQFPAEESFEVEGEAEVEAEAEGGEGQAEAEEAAEEEAAPEPTEEEIWASMPPLDKEEEEEESLPKTTKHGTYIDMLLAGGLLSGGQKRPGTDGLGGSAKRAK